MANIDASMDILDVNMTIKPILARYSPIAPITLLEHLHNHSILGNYLLILGHDVIPNLPRYQHLIQEVLRVYGDAFIIMDNSAVECNEPLTLDDPAFRRACDTLPINCIVAPDVIGDKDATLRHLDRLKFADSMMMHRQYKFMCIPQGATTVEWMQCADAMASFMKEREQPFMWGVPRWATNQWGSRMPLISYLNAVSDAHQLTQQTIHLMGMSQNFADDIRCTGMRNVVGIDSANPVVLGNQLKDLRQVAVAQAFNVHVDRGNFWQHTTITPWTTGNIRFVREQIAQAHPGAVPHEGLL